MKKSSDKGRRGERDAAKYLCSLGFSAERCARNGVIGGDDLIVHDLPGVHIEVKRNEELRDDGALMDRYWRQSLDNANGRVPCLLWRTNNRKWRLTLNVGISYGGARATVTGDQRIARVLRFVNGGEKRPEAVVEIREIGGER